MNSILTVITPATSYDLTTLATVKSKLGITTTTEDTKIAAWIKEASDFAANYCGRVFGKETVSEQFRLQENKNQLILSRFPVGVVTSVTEDGTVLDPTDYEVDSSIGTLYRLAGDGITQWVSKKVTVIYSGGYTLMGELPYDIESAVIAMVTHTRSASTRDPFAKRIEIPDVETVDYWVGGMSGSSNGLPASITGVLDLYRVIRF